MFSILAITCFVVLAITFAPSSPRSGNDKPVVEARNEFTNYYLFGKESTNSVGSQYNPREVYQVVLATEENDVAFFEKAKDYFDSYMAQYNTLFKEDNIEEKSGDVENFSKMFDFIYRYNKTPPLSLEDIFETFINIGAEQTYIFVENYYKYLSETTYEDAKTYVNALVTYSLAQVDRFELYAVSECIRNGEIIEDSCTVTAQTINTDRLQNALQIADSDILDFPQDTVVVSIQKLLLIQHEEL